jgi:hypothetical protein
VPELIKKKVQSTETRVKEASAEEKGVSMYPVRYTYFVNHHEEDEMMDAGERYLST